MLVTRPINELAHWFDKQFKETVRAICRLRKFIIRSFQSNEVHLYIANNTNLFPYFKVIPNYYSFYHTNIICLHMLILVFIFFLELYRRN